jgi:hypothetical protein
VLILLSFPGLYRDQLLYRERKLPFDLFWMPTPVNILICPFRKNFYLGKFVVPFCISNFSTVVIVFSVITRSAIDQKES